MFISEQNGSSQFQKSGNLRKNQLDFVFLDHEEYCFFVDGVLRYKKKKFLFWSPGEQLKTNKWIDLLYHLIRFCILSFLTNLDFKGYMVPCFQDRRNNNQKHNSPVLLQSKCC